MRVGKTPEPEAETDGKTPLPLAEIEGNLVPEAETDGKIPLPLAEIEGNPVPEGLEIGTPLTLDTPEPEANGGTSEPPGSVV